jgi:hypothetical protein
MANHTTSEATISTNENERPQEQLAIKGTAAVHKPKENGETAADDLALKAPSVNNPNVGIVDNGKTTTFTAFNREAQESVKSATLPPEEAVEAPAPIAKPTAPAPMATMLPAKRPAQPNSPAPPEAKRTKAAPSFPPARTTTVSPPLLDTSEISLLAEEHRQLELSLKRRKEVAKEREMVAQNSAPLRQRIAEERARIRKQREEEDRACAEETSLLEYEVALLKELIKGDGGN